MRTLTTLVSAAAVVSATMIASAAELRGSRPQLREERAAEPRRPGWRPATAFSGVATGAIPTGIFGPTYYYTRQFYYPGYPYYTPYAPAPIYYEYPVPGPMGCQRENQDGWRYRVC
jgi:hypothetical protein